MDHVPAMAGTFYNWHCWYFSLVCWFQCHYRRTESAGVDSNGVVIETEMKSVGLLEVARPPEA